MKNTLFIFPILLLLASLGQVMADLYLPSLPAMQDALETSKRNVQLTISLYVVGYAFSQLLYGPLSDALGRRIPLVAGLAITAVGSFICFWFPEIHWIILGRFLQGLGAGAGLTITRSILRDIFSTHEMAKLGSLIGVGGVIIMSCAPLLGGYIQEIAGWHANFTFLFVYSLFILLLSLSLPETNPHRRVDYLKPARIYTAAKTLLTSRLYMSYTICLFFAFAAIFCWITISPILLLEHFQLSPSIYGWIMFGIGLTFATSCFLNSQLVPKLGIVKMIRVGLSVMILGGIGVISFAAMDNWIAIILPVFVFMAGTGLIFANAFAGALEPFPQIAGLASALLGFFQIIGGALASTLVASLSLVSVSSLGVLILVCSLLALGVKLALTNKKAQA